MRIKHIKCLEQGVAQDKLTRCELASCYVSMMYGPWVTVSKQGPQVSFQI